MGFQQCGSTSYNFPDQSQVSLLGISNYNCIANKSYSLLGNYFNIDMKYLEIKLWKCQNKTNTIGTCKDQAAIDNYFSGETLSVAFTNNWFDSSDYTTPIKPFIDDQLFFIIDPNIGKRANLLV